MSPVAANMFREAVRKLEPGFEFKFSRTSTARRKAFFQLALKHDFKFAVCAIDKTIGQWRFAPKMEMHWATATDLAVSLRSAYHAAEAADPKRPLRDPIIVDDNQDQKFLEAVRVAFHGLRSKLHPHVAMVRSPKFRGSAPDEVLHLVDMVCGAVGDHIDGNSTWYDVIRSRCVGLTVLP